MTIKTETLDPVVVEADETSMSSTDKNKVSFSKAYVYYVIILLGLINLFNYMDRMVVAVVLQPMKVELGLSDTQVGLLTGVAFSLFYAVMGIPIARWADSGNRRNIIALAIAVWSGMTAVCGMAQNFVHLFLARVGVGAGEAGCIPSAHSIIADYVPIEKRSSAIGLFSACGNLGLLLGLALGGWIANEYGWRIAFLVLGVPGLLLALVVRLTLKEPPRGHADGVDHASLSSFGLKEALKRLYRTRSYVFIVLALSFLSFGYLGMTQWFPSFYIRSFGADIKQVGLMFGLSFGIGGAAGTFLGGYIADHFVKKEVRWALWLSCLSCLISVPLILGIFLAPSFNLSLVFTFFATASVVVSMGPVLGMVQGVTPHRMRALAASIAMFAAAVIGMGSGPLFIGILSDWLSIDYGQDSLKFALIYGTPVMLLPVLFFYLGAKHLDHDLAEARVSDN